MIKAVIFDFGGVLMKTGDPAGRREWEQRLNLRAGDLERVIHGSRSWLEVQSGAMTPDRYWQDVAGFLGIPESSLAQLQYDYFRDDRLDADLMALIGSLRKASYKVGLLSNDAPTLEHKLRADLGIYDAFDSVTISGLIGVMKPDARAYGAALQALDMSGAETLFIDDNVANVDGARTIGMSSIHYRAGMDLRAALRPLVGDQLEL